MSPLKFSSAASRSIERVFLSAPGYQSFPYARRRKPSLDFLSNGCGLFLAPVKVNGDFGLVAQVVRDHGVHVRKGNGGVLLRNLLGGRTSVERRDNGVERHPRPSDTHDANSVHVNWNPLNSFGRVHGKHSWLDCTAQTRRTGSESGRLSGPLPMRVRFRRFEQSRFRRTPIDAGNEGLVDQTGIEPVTS